MLHFVKSLALAWRVRCARQLLEVCEKEEINANRAVLFAMQELRDSITELENHQRTAARHATGC